MTNIVFKIKQNTIVDNLSIRIFNLVAEQFPVDIFDQNLELS